MRKLGFLIFLLLLGVGVCWAQTYDLPTSTFDEAGGETSDGYTIEDSTGQGIIGGSSGTNYDLFGIGYQYTTNTLPQATGLDPDNEMVGESTPILSWTYSDKDGDTQTKYHVQVIGHVDSGVVTSSETGYTPTSLPNGSYTWRVRVHDGWDWSGWTDAAAFEVMAYEEAAPEIIITSPPADPGDLETGRPPGYTITGPEFEVIAPPGEGIILVIYELRKQPEGRIIFMRRVSDILVERLPITIPEEHLPLEDGFYTFYIVRIEYESGKFAEDIYYDFYIDTTPPAISCIPEEGSILGVGEERPLISTTVEDLTGGINPDSFRMTITDTEHAFGASVDEFLEYIEESRTPYAGSKGVVSYEDYSAATPFPGGLADGGVMVSTKAEDWVALEATQTWSFTVDTEPPEGRVVINQRFNGDRTGAERSASCGVTLTLDADGTGTKTMKFSVSNREDFAGAIEEEIPSPAELVSFQKSWSLEPIRGIRRVFVRFKDEANNRSRTYSDDIFLNIFPPMVFITSRPPMVIRAKKAEVEFSFKSSEDGSRFKYRFDGEPWPAKWSSPPASKGQTPPRVFGQGSHSFEVKAAKDINGDGMIQSSEESLPKTAHWIIHPEGIRPFMGPPESPIKYWREE